MSVLEIKKYPDPVLKRKALSVEEVDGALQRLIDDMIETMYAAPGIGLAAPQVGESKRVIVVHVKLKEEEHPLIVLLNPEIIERDGKVVSEEGCLSVPGYVSNIERAAAVRVRGLDREGRSVEIEAEGLLARALQHEIDHLDGLLFVDRMSPIKREFFRKRYLRRLKESA
ncbi:MAG TPA: peptide deformylase [Nitrospirae bacterium]|nr:peptide deformylase [Nitrospirota bacterium]